MHEKVNKVRNMINAWLAVVALISALAGGFLLAISSGGGPGSILVGVAHAGWWWLPMVWFGVAVVVLLGDWGRDGVPNRPAIAAALTFPSFWVAMWTDRCGDKLFAAVSAINRGAGTSFKKAVSTHLVAHGALADGALALSILFIVVAVVFAWRYAAKKKGTGVGNRPGGVPTTTGPISRVSAR